MMPNRLRTGLFAILIALSVSLNSETSGNDTSGLTQRTITVAAAAHVAKDIPVRFTTQDCLKENFIFGEEPARGAVEVLIMCQAMAYVSLDIQFEIILVPNYARGLKRVYEGSVDIAAETIWYSDLKPEFAFASTAVIDPGTFEKGFYTMVDHPIQSLPLGAFKPADYRALTVETWTQDNIALRMISGRIAYAVGHPHRKNMLKQGRGDYLLMEFPFGENLNLNFYGMPIVPVKGVKIALPESRHFVVGKALSEGKAFIDELNSGLKKLKSEGVFLDHLNMMGFKLPQTESWKILRPGQTEFKHEN